MESQSVSSTYWEGSFVVMKVEFKWTIHNFRDRSLRLIAHESISSTLFHADGEEQLLQWKVLLVPGNFKVEDGQWISLYIQPLRAKENYQTYYINYCLTIDADVTQIKHSGTKSYAESDKFPFGFPEFITHKNLLAGNFLQDGNLTVICNIEYEKCCSSLVSCDLSISSHPSSISHYVLDLFTSKKYSDIDIVVGEEKFPAHKVILSMRSLFFATMFAHPDMKEIAKSCLQNCFRRNRNRKNIVQIEDVEPKVFESLLRFMYTNQLELQSEEMAMDVLEAANRFLLEQPKRKSEEFLSKQLKLKNCSELLVLADCVDAPLLKKTAIDFIRLNLDIVKNTDGWKTMMTSHNDLYCDIMQQLMGKFTLHFSH